MTLDEAIRLLLILRHAFPGALRHLARDQDFGAMAAVWKMGLGDLPYPLVEKVAVEHIKASKRFPTIAELRELAELSAGEGDRITVKWH